MSEIISSKNGRLHIYVRQDKYKGKLKSENWVGRTFHNGRQKVISSGTTNLEEAKIILEKWYDDLISGSTPESTEKNKMIFHLRMSIMYPLKQLLKLKKSLK